MADTIMNMVTISLEDYTKMVVELHDLKGLVAGYKRKIARCVEEEIHYSAIESIGTTTECWNLLSSSDESLLRKFTNDYSWRWESISRDNFDILVVCGIGGSYLGAKSAIDALKGLKSDDKLEIKSVFFRKQMLKENKSLFFTTIHFCIHSAREPVNYYC